MKNIKYVKYDRTYKKAYKGPHSKKTAKKLLDWFLNSINEFDDMIVKGWKGFLRRRAGTDKYDIFIKFKYLPIVYCPRCKNLLTDELDIEAVENIGMCLRCDHIEAEIVISLMNK